MNEKMKDLLVAVRHLAQQEYRRAETKFGPVNNTSHESYAIILEEITEHREAEMALDKALQEFWHGVRHDHSYADQSYDLREGLDAALLAAAEMIQAAAMLYKAGLTVGDYVRDTFTKWDLLDGQIVKIRDGSEYEYHNGSFYSGGRRYCDLSRYADDLSCIDLTIPTEDRPAWDIVHVFCFVTPDRGGSTGWSREESK